MGERAGIMRMSHVNWEFKHAAGKRNLNKEHSLLFLAQEHNIWQLHLHSEQSSILHSELTSPQKYWGTWREFTANYWEHLTSEHQQSVPMLQKKKKIAKIFQANTFKMQGLFHI